MSTTDRSANYESRLTMAASADIVFAAVATIPGLQGWWTPHVTGSAEPGHELHFMFDGVDERITMRVDDRRAPTTICWTCVEHTGHPEWIGTQPMFTVVARTQPGAGGSELRLCHRGLEPSLACFEQCERGWDYFLHSLTDFATTGRGAPYGA